MAIVSDGVPILTQQVAPVIPYAVPIRHHQKYQLSAPIDRNRTVAKVVFFFHLAAPTIRGVVA